MITKLKTSIWLTFIYLPVLVIFCAIFGCSKVEKEEIFRTIALNEIPPIKTTGDVYSVCIRSDKSIVYSTERNLFLLDKDLKSTISLDNQYFYQLLETKNGEIIGLNVNSLYLFNLNTNTKSKISFDQAVLDYSSDLAITADGTIYLLTSGKLFKSINDGLSWTDISSTHFSFGIGGTSQLLTRGDEVYINLNTQELYSTKNGGNTFEFICNIRSPSAFGGVVSLGNNEDIFLATSDGGLLESSDNGKTFSPFVGLSQFYSVGAKFIPQNGSFLALSPIQGMARSIRNPIKFQYAGGLKCNQGAARGNISAIWGEDGLYISNDDGNNWLSIGEDLVVATDIFIENGNTLMAYIPIGIGSETGLYRYQNSQWYVEPLGFYQAYTRDDNTVYVFHNFSLGLYSSDNGATFEEFENPLNGILPNPFTDKKVSYLYFRKNKQIIAGVGENRHPNSNLYLTNKTIHFDKESLQWILNGDAPGYMTKVVENANENLFSQYAVVVDFVRYFNTKSTDGGATWNELDIEYFPMSFNSVNNFVSSNNGGGLWFSNLEESNIYSYTFDLGTFTMANAAFDENDYLYFTSSEGKIYKTQSQLIRP